MRWLSKPLRDLHAPPSEGREKPLSPQQQHPLPRRTQGCRARRVLGAAGLRQQGLQEGGRIPQLVFLTTLFSVTWFKAAMPFFDTDLMSVKWPQQEQIRFYFAQTWLAKKINQNRQRCRVGLWFPLWEGSFHCYAKYSSRCPIGMQFP